MRADKILLKKIILFGFFGILTTLLNIALYMLFRLIKIPVSASTALAWFFCVLFAFVTNKKYVFQSKKLELRVILREFLLFYGSRLASGILDVILMVLFVNVLSFNEAVAKITDEIIISLMNFILSFAIFNKRQ